jgi:predicted small secreted protein
MRRLLAALAACALLVAACGDDDDVATDVGQGAETTSTTATPTTEGTMPVDLVTDLPDELPAGELELRFDAVNVSDEPVSLTFPSGQDGDAHLLDADGESVYTWSATRSFIQVIQERTLDAGEAYPVTLDADLRGVAPGTYTLELSLAVQDPPPPLQLEVTIVEP